MAKLINIAIDAEGNFSIDLTGFHGKGCADVMRAFDGIGKRVVDRKKPEFKEVKLGQTCK